MPSPANFVHGAMPRTSSESSSRSASAGSLPSLSDGASQTSATSSRSSICADPAALRPYEHLAVLLPRDLWKPDTQATHCDEFACRAPFSLLARKHHCRKCGGIFCTACSSRSTPLLDTTSLSFLHPPKNTPLSTFASEAAPLLPHRVCDSCYAQIHGLPPRPLPVSPAVESFPVATTAAAKAHPRRSHSSVPEPDLSQKFGALASYPLCYPSAVCKASGGGRWVPAPDPIDPALRRIPGHKAPYEIALEREEYEARRKFESPLICDGEFRMRKPVDRKAAQAANASR